VNIITWDLETGGLSPDSDDIVEIGMVISDGFDITKRAGCFVVPTKDIPSEAVRIHGITTKMATDEGFKWSQAGPRFAKRLHDADVWCGFNLDFDIMFARHCLRKIGIDLEDRPVIDLFKIVQRYVPAAVLPRKNLGKVAEFLDVPLDNAHRAVDDSVATLYSLQSLLGKLGITLDDILSGRRYLGPLNYGSDPFESFFNGLIGGIRMRG